MYLLHITARSFDKKVFSHLPSNHAWTAQELFPGAATYQSNGKCVPEICLAPVSSSPGQAMNLEWVGVHWVVESLPGHSGGAYGHMAIQ